jgi:hypothetical protein
LIELGRELREPRPTPFRIGPHLFRSIDWRIERSRRGAVLRVSTTELE